jgi:uncharacterized lipoprotein YajG
MIQVKRFLYLVCCGAILSLLYACAGTEQTQTFNPKFKLLEADKIKATAQYS